MFYILVIMSYMAASPFLEQLRNKGGVDVKFQLLNYKLQFSKVDGVFPDREERRVELTIECMVGRTILGFR